MPATSSHANPHSGARGAQLAATGTGKHSALLATSAGVLFLLGSSTVLAARRGIGRGSGQPAMGEATDQP